MATEPQPPDHHQPMINNDNSNSNNNDSNDNDSSSNNNNNSSNNNRSSNNNSSNNNNDGDYTNNPNDLLQRGPPHEMDDMVRFAWANYKRAKRILYLFELRLCSMALEYLQSEIDLLPCHERPIMLWFRRVELFGTNIEQAIHDFLMRRLELQTVTLIGWTRYLGEGASVIDDYIPILNCLNLSSQEHSDSTLYPHHIHTVEVEHMRLTRVDMGALLGGASVHKCIKLSRSTLDMEFLSGFCATITSPRILRMVQCFASSNTTLQAMAQNSWQLHDQMYELDLQNNRFTTMALSSIAQLLLQQCTSLQTLKLGSNFELFHQSQQQPQQHSQVWKAFITALSQMQNLTAVHLDSCKMTVQMATELIQSIQGTCRTLILHGTNLFDDDNDNNNDDYDEVEVVPTNNSRASTSASQSAAANSSSSSTALNRETQALPWLSSPPPPPASLAFFQCLGSSGGNYGRGSGCCLVDLVLGGCNIGSFCAMSLFAALEKNSTLEKLDLRDNPFTVNHGTPWEKSLSRLSSQLVQLWLPLPNFLVATRTTTRIRTTTTSPTNNKNNSNETTQEDDLSSPWSIFEAALFKNIYLRNVLEINMARDLPAKQRIALRQFTLRNQGIERAYKALQTHCHNRLVWPRIVTQLWNGWEYDQNASAVYTFLRRLAEGDEWQTITSSSSSTSSSCTALDQWNHQRENNNKKGRKRPLFLDDGANE